VATPARHSNHGGNEIMPQIAPGARDIVVPKQKPSGFHGTNLLSYLTMLGCDSVIVCGTTTSGCVRGTVIDSFSYNFRTAVIEDGCFDRSQASHAINLFDMHAKYADVVTSEEVIVFLKSLPANKYDLPPGGRS
jgi:maleamate amidohydrolase